MDRPDDYFDLDAILASDQRVACNVPADFPFHVLQANATTSSSRGQHTAELPLWLLQSLYKPDLGQISHVESLQLPKVYNPALRHILEADPSVCDLHKMGPYFYECGLMLVQMNAPDKHVVSSVLIKTFLGRIAWLMDRAQFSIDEQQPATLDKLECRLYDAGKHSRTDYVTWKRGRSHLIRKSSGVKRRFSER